MKKLRIKYAVAAYLCALSITPVKAAQLSLDITGNVLLGINGVLVGGLAYDVAFGDTSTTSNQTFVFNNLNTAKAATDALFRLFDVGRVAAQWGDMDAIENGRYINGLSDSAPSGFLDTHYDANGNFVYNYQRFGSRLAGGGLSSARVSYSTVFLTEAEMVSMTDRTVATWSLPTLQQPNNVVPEPTALTLLGIGALGYAASRRQSKYPTQPNTMPTTA